MRRFQKGRSIGEAASVSRREPRSFDARLRRARLEFAIRRQPDTLLVQEMQKINNLADTLPGG
jgi:hypothetical protein